MKNETEHNITKMDFKEFNKLVKSYLPLNKSKSRFLITLKDNSFYFYRYDKLNNQFVKELGLLK